MYCSECGKKIKKGSKFCGECGAKVKKEKTKFDFKNNKLAIIISAVVALLVICLVTLNILTSPKHVASKYIKASINKDSNALYSLLDLDGDKTFISKKTFKKIIESNTKDSNIENYKIGEVIYGTSNLSAKVKFTYTTKGGSSENNRYIILNKDKDKKFLFFDKWTISDYNATNIILKDYKIIVPKDTKVTYGGINVSSKYLDKDSSYEKIDVYKLPQVFIAKTDIEVTLKNGIKVKEEVRPSIILKQYQLKLTGKNLSEEDAKKITKASKESLEIVYKSAIESKSFDEIKSNFKAKDLTNLEKSYTSFSKNLNNHSSVKLTSITFDDIDIYNATIDNDGNLVVSLKTKFTYKVTYPTLDVSEEVEPKTNTNYFTLVFDISSKNYNLVDVKNLKTYFY
ncbi:MAG: zinc ribbon domain-containing protein [Bacilli bacterium]|nr:zinc ribbon domain-containing protein [Bacilli bacterium]